jgi:penicillin-binding protein 1A
MARRLGITTDVPPVLSVALGTPLVSVQDMADAYLTFATRGLHVAPSLIERVTDADGRMLYVHRVANQRVLEPRVADVVTWALRQVVADGTGTRAQLPVDVAGKTGTTQAHGDAWFVGYTPGLSTAVWMGYPEGQKRGMESVHGIQVTGGSLPAEAWRRFMAVATRNPRYAGSFGPAPDLAPGRVLAGSGRMTATSSTTTTSSSVPSSTTTTTTSSTSTSSTSTTTTTSTTTSSPPNTVLP